MIGQALSHYQIQEKLGEGGMGVAYRALDTHLDRTVCIKVLRTESVADPERKRRFVREAKTASALNHPNIVTIHDIDTTGGVTHIAMEYVRGKTLGQLLPRAGLPLPETLRLAVQIADALAAAHGAGVVHRDLKPANIMVAETGMVKILDFGLAKLTEPVEPDAAGGAETVDIAREPETDQGTILGTAAYMSPEQAEGKHVDARSDIFSFGSVLYEMVSGRKAFSGETKMLTISAILRDEAKPLSEVSWAIPRDLDKIVTRCLRKDPARRWQTMADLKVALEELKEESSTGSMTAPGAPAAGQPGRRRWMVAAAAAVMVAGAGLAWWLGRAPRGLRTPALVKLTSDSGLTADPAISRDGRLLAYASDRGGDGNLDIWVRQTAGGEPIRLTRHPSADRAPCFSPDGSRIAFRSDRDGGGVFVVSALGGEERLLVKHGHAPRFSPDGQWIAYRIGETGGSIEVILASGGQPRRLETGITGAWNPIWSPDGKRLLTIGTQLKTLQRDLFLVPVDGGPVSSIGATALLARHQLTIPGPADWTGDHLYFSARSGDTTNLWRIAMPGRTGQLSGEPQRLTFGTGAESQSSVSEAGNLVFSSLAENADIWSVPLDAAAGKVAGDARRLTDDAANEVYPSLSADGTKMAFVTWRSGNLDIWFKDLTTGKERPLAATPAREWFPRISRDGSRVVYTQGRNAYAIAVEGGAAEKLSEQGLRPEHWSLDSRTVLWNRAESTDLETILLFDLSSKAFALLLKEAGHSLHSPYFSPDDRWITFYMTLGTASRRIYVAPFHGPTEIPPREWIAITGGGELDREPRWSPDGNLLYFLSERDGFRCVWAQRLEPAAKRPVGTPFPVYHSHMARRLIGGVSDTNAAGLSVAPGKLVFSATETTGNIWMLKF